MRNDPHSFDPAATVRDFDHQPARSFAKMAGLFEPIEATGVPLGGIGTGGITQASDGRFSRWTIKGGGVSHFDLPANGFILRVDNGTKQAMALQPAPQGPELSAFSFSPSAPRWGGLYPFAWSERPPLGDVVAECLSFSPVFPGDLETASLPVALFQWRLTNTGTEPADATLVFHMANMNGCFSQFNEGQPERVAAGLENYPMNDRNMVGVLQGRRRAGPEPLEGDGQWGIALQPSAGSNTSSTVCFDGTSDGRKIWEPLLATGELPNLGPGFVTEGGFRDVSPGLPTGAIASRQTLAPGESCQVTFALTWDLPIITFGQGRKWYRAYTDKWGRTGTNASALCRHALNHFQQWQSDIARWHETTTRTLGEAPHRAGMALNELYFLVDGLTVFTSAHDAPDNLQHFGLIECHDYALYNTLDLWIYAAEAVARFDPELSAMVSRDFASQLTQDDQTPRLHQWERSSFPLNPSGSCPHDLGGPNEDPFVVPNSYTYRDATLWKDLNCDLVLCLWRDGEKMGGEWRARHFGAVEKAIEHLQQFDRDGDGLIENEGIPDQTFDNIPMTGPSSYCGGLWIAALMAGARMAEEAGYQHLADRWNEQSHKAAHAFNTKLFNGQFFRVDTDGPFSQASFIEQLFGPFLARRYGLGEIVPQNHARSALKWIFENNYLDEGGGMGAVSLANVPKSARRFLPHSDDTSFQTSENQPGFNFSLCAQLEEWGLNSEADQLRRSLYRELYEKRNLIYQTPAAFDATGPTARAILNMRPLSVWWMT